MALQAAHTTCNPARHRSHAPQVRAAQPPVRSCCPSGSQSTFCDAHRVATLPAQYRFLPALRHVEAFLTRFTATLTLTFTLTYPELEPEPELKPEPEAESQP